MKLLGFFVILAAAAAGGSALAQPIQTEATYFDPAIRCDRTIYQQVSTNGRSWSQPLNPGLPRFESATGSDFDSRGMGGIDDAFDMTFSKQQAEPSVPRGDWTITLAVTAPEGAQIFDNNRGGSCSRGSNTDHPTNGALNLRVTDDTNANKTTHWCFIVDYPTEVTYTEGSRTRRVRENVKMGVDVQCTMTHNHAREAQRTQERAARSTGHSGGGATPGN